MRPELRTLTKRLAKCSTALAFAFVAASMVFSIWADHSLAPLAESLGEVRMRQAAHCEAAGMPEEALDLYQRALAGDFHGDANRNHCEKRAGVVLFGLGRHEDALTYLARAQSVPERSLNGFGPLVETLLALERHEEAHQTAERWLSESGDDTDNTANAHRSLGRVALAEGDLTTAEHRFQAALSIVPDHAARADLARAHAARGDLEAARATMTDYLATAPPDKDTQANWALLESWLR